jgi:glycosyltransferase involved in cell wall biosynthesis
VNILIVHNHYQLRGGEDAVVDAETRLLESHGHQVMRYERHNAELKKRGWLGTAAAGLATVWAAGSFQDVKTIVAKKKPDVAHFHNTFPLISPSAYYACAQAGIPIVQTLHNYRLLCPAATFLRDGKVCEECLGKVMSWPGVVHGCYRGSRTQTGAVAAMQASHRVLGTWREKVDLYIALSEFARRKYIDGGLPAERIVVKANFVHPDPGPKQGPGEYALYAGFLSEYKGLRILIDAWKRMRQAVPLKIAGDGPLFNEIKEEIRMSNIQCVDLLGQVSSAEIVSLMHSARFLVFPSLWFEGFPVTIAEAFACGLPVVTSRLGSVAEIVADGSTGLHFTAGDSADLAAKVEWAWNNADEISPLGQNARATFEREYTAERNYDFLMSIYQRAVANRGSLEYKTASAKPADVLAGRKAG